MKAMGPNTPEVFNVTLSLLSFQLSLKLQLLLYLFLSTPCGLGSIIPHLLFSFPSQFTPFSISQILVLIKVDNSHHTFPTSKITTISLYIKTHIIV